MHTLLVLAHRANIWVRRLLIPATPAMKPLEAKAERRERHPRRR
jgi:hypothetical protein